MIDCSLGDAFGFCPASFRSIVLQCDARLPMHIHKLLDRVVRVQCFPTGCVFECNIAHRRSAAFKYACCSIISGVTRCSLFMMLYLCSMFQCGLHAELWVHIGIFMNLISAETRNSVSFFPFAYLVLWVKVLGGWGLWIDLLSIALSRPCIDDLFNYNNNNKSMCVEFLYILFIFLLKYGILQNMSSPHTTTPFCNAQCCIKI